MKNIFRLFALFLCLLSSTSLFSLMPHININSGLVNRCKPLLEAAVKIGQTIRHRGEIIKSCLNEIGYKPVLRVRHLALMGAAYLVYKNLGTIGRCSEFVVDSLLSGMLRLGLGTYYYLGRLGFVRGMPNYRLSFNGNLVQFTLDDNGTVYQGTIAGYFNTRPRFSSSISDSAIRRLGCNHYLHEACFQTYLHQQRGNSNLQCMICRTPIVNPYQLRTTPPTALPSRVEPYAEGEHDGKCPICLGEYSPDVL